MWSAEWKIKERGCVEWLLSSPYSFIIFLSPLIFSFTLFFKVTLTLKEHTIWWFKGNNVSIGWDRRSTSEISLSKAILSARDQSQQCFSALEVEDASIWSTFCSVFTLFFFTLLWPLHCLCLLYKDGSLISQLASNPHFERSCVLFSPEVSVPVPVLDTTFPVS